MSTSSGVDFHGRVALITGSAQGIGWAIAQALHEAGAIILLNDRQDEPELQSAYEEARSQGWSVEALVADVSNEAAVDRMFQQIDRLGMGLDILVNNAGTSWPQTIDQISLDDWKRLLDINLTSAYLCSRRAIERIRRRSDSASATRSASVGRIVNISSVAGEQGSLVGHVHYSASKSGLLGLTKSLARYCARWGITVNAVAPGMIRTGLLTSVHQEAELQALSEKIPLGLGEPKDVAAAVAFLCSDGAKYITGATLDVNGGLYLR